MAGEEGEEEEVSCGEGRGRREVIELVAWGGLMDFKQNYLCLWKGLTRVREGGPVDNQGQGEGGGRFRGRIRRGEGGREGDMGGG